MWYSNNWWLWLWLQLKTYINMCSCSGSCNCNSTTIPRGPQGLQGNQGIPGLPSTVPGPPGNNGLNAFTTLTDDFVQPAIGSSNNIFVVNNSWMAINEIIYIGPAPSGLPVEAGGFYQVTNKLGVDQATVVNLGWTIPGTVFVSPATTVGAIGTIVTPSGTIGATGEQGLDGTSITEVQNQGSVITAVAGTYTLTTVVTDANQICVSNGDMAKFVFIVGTFSSSPPAGPDKPYFEFDVNTVTASIRTGSLSNDEIKLDVTSTYSYATMEFTIKRLSQTTAVCFVKSYLDNVNSTKSIVNYVGDVSINPIGINFSASNTFSVKITLPQSMSYSLISSWVEKYSA